MDLQQQRFGVEIEFTGITREEAALVLSKFLGSPVVHTGGGYDKRYVVDDEGRKWSILKDSSILPQVRRNGEYAGELLQCEFVTPICKYEDIEKIQEIVRRFRCRGALSNSSCGMHIHVDGANHNASSLKRLSYIFYSKQDLIYKTLHVNPSRERFCEKLTEGYIKKLDEKKHPTFDDVAKAWYGTPDTQRRRNQPYDHSRYRGLNLHSFFSGTGTVEFRMFNSTIEHAGKVKANIQFALAISAQAINQSSARYTPTYSSNECYTFRTWLIRIGLNGDEYETCRHHMLANLTGAKDWKDKAAAQKRREERAKLLASQIDLQRQQSDNPNSFTIDHILSSPEMEIQHSPNEPMVLSLREQLDSFLQQISKPDVSDDERQVIMDILNRRSNTNQQQSTQAVNQPINRRGRNR